jgi:hypothetical protein
LRYGLRAENVERREIELTRQYIAERFTRRICFVFPGTPFRCPIVYSFESAIHSLKGTGRARANTLKLLAYRETVDDHVRLTTACKCFGIFPGAMAIKWLSDHAQNFTLAIRSPKSGE